jgi:hypothetical protein
MNKNAFGPLFNSMPLCNKHTLQTRDTLLSGPLPREVKNVLMNFLLVSEAQEVHTIFHLDQFCLMRVCE